MHALLLKILLGSTLAASVFVSLAKGALHNFSKAKLLALLAQAPEATRERLRKYLDKSQRLIFTVVVLDLLFDGLFIALAVVIFGPYVLSIILPLLIILTIGEMIPRILGRIRPEEVLLVTLRVLRVLDVVFRPIILPFMFMDSRLRRAGPRHADFDSRSRHIAEEILSVVDEGERNGALEEAERDMIEGIVELRDVAVHEVMTPRTKMVSVEVRTPIDEVREVIRDSGHSRVPVYEANRDNIVGVLYAKDLVGREREANSLAQTMRKPYFVPETKRIGELLKELRANKVHMAIVVDEYGGTAGLVTMEDVLEQVVGEIADEYDGEQDVMIHSLGPNLAEVNARARIDEVNEALGVRLPESEEFSTMGGLVFALLGKVPRRGEQVHSSDVVITVTDVDERKINKVKLEFAPTERS